MEARGTVLGFVRRATNDPTKHPIPNTARKPRPLWARILPVFASFDPDADYSQFEAEGIIAIHENVRGTIRQQAKGVNKKSVKMCSLVLTPERLTLYEPIRPIANIRRPDPAFKQITFEQLDDGRLRITILETAVGDVKSRHRGTLELQMRLAKIHP